MRIGEMELEKPLDLQGSPQPLDSLILERVGMRNDQELQSKKWQQKKICPNDLKVIFISIKNRVIAWRGCAIAGRWLKKFQQNHLPWTRNHPCRVRVDRISIHRLSLGEASCQWVMGFDFFFPTYKPETYTSKSNCH